MEGETAGCSIKAGNTCKKLDNEKEYQQLIRLQTIDEWVIGSIIDR